jgi:tetratricopeptide (TPR) repeat protein
MSIQDLANQAVAALQRGNPAEAERQAQALLRQAPRDFTGLHLLAIARFQQGRVGPALEAMQQAVAVNTTVPPAWSNLGSMQLDAGDKAGALASFERALALAPPPAPPELLCNIGNLMVELERIEDGVRRYGQALAVKPDLVPALVGRANALQLQGRYAEALTDCDKALQTTPDFAPALNNKVVCLLGLSRFAEALAAADRSLAARPDGANTMSNRASAFLGLHRPAEALAASEQALAREPAFAQALCNKGAALSALGRQDEALAAYDAALGLDPRLHEAWINRVTPLRHAERYADALASVDKALAIGAPTAEALRSRAIALFDLGRHDEALESIAGAVALNPADAEAKFNQAQMLMRQGDFAAGLPLYEERKRLDPPYGAARFAQPLWLGESDIAGKTIFLHPEQGLGDTIMFSRFAAPLAERGAQVKLAVPEKLRALFRSFAPKVAIVDAPPAQFDLHAPLASLPLALKSTPDTIPAFPSYLAAEPVRVARWREKIGSGGFRIGIAWQGAKVSNDIGRSFPVALFRDIAAMEGVCLIALQKGEATKQLAALPPGMTVETLGDDFDSGPDAFLDTAAAMEACDLVITSDTAIAHLAGALGRPVWIALRHSPEWRWFLERRDTPWYPTARLFRQAAPGDWDGVFASIGEELRQLRNN